MKVTDEMVERGANAIAECQAQDDDWIACAIEQEGWEGVLARAALEAALSQEPSVQVTDEMARCDNHPNRKATSIGEKLCGECYREWAASNRPQPEPSVQVTDEMATAAWDAYCEAPRARPMDDGTRATIEGVLIGLVVVFVVIVASFVIASWIE